MRVEGFGLRVGRFALDVGRWDVGALGVHRLGKPTAAVESPPSFSWGRRVRRPLPTAVMGQSASFDLKVRRPSLRLSSGGKACQVQTRRLLRPLFLSFPSGEGTWGPDDGTGPSDRAPCRSQISRGVTSTAAYPSGQLFRPALAGQKGRPTRGDSTDGCYHRLSTHPVPPSPGRGLEPDRLGSGERRLFSQSTTPAPESLP
jgi:hypothetical protein